MGQESVDKRIIADIGLFAAELAESGGHEVGHIVLVSGDSDYGYILARLRDKAYIGKIIIFINDVTKQTLTQHADHTHCLFQSNLTQKENPFSKYNQRQINCQSYSPFHGGNNYQNRNKNGAMQQFSLPTAYHVSPSEPYKRNKTADTTNGHRIPNNKSNSNNKQRSHTQRSSSTSNNAYGHKKILKKNDKKKQEEKANANGMYRRKNNESEMMSHENLEQQ